MKRSTINQLMQEADAFFKRHQFVLPPFAYWTPEDWSEFGDEVGEIVDNSLGWDVTDYGLDDFLNYGLIMFTLRNGSPKTGEINRGTPYAEKLAMLEVDQQHQMHFHWKKAEDIVNRAGGKLALQLYNANAENNLADTDITVYINSVRRTLPAGDIVLLNPGDSITLRPRCYHRFWAEEARVLMGEVSTVNDDSADNHFYKPFGSGRFTAIEEDEPPRYLLCTDYANYWQPMDSR